MLIFLWSAVLAAVILGLKFSRDIFPRPLKVWLSKRALDNWMKRQPRKFGREKESTIYPKSFTQIGIVADEQETVAERPARLTNSLLRDEYVIYGTDEQGNGVTVKFTRLPNSRTQAHILILLHHEEMYRTSFEGNTPNENEFSLGNLRVETAEPFKAYRLWYNGTMIQEKTSQIKEAKVHHIVFNFLWKALDSPLDNRKNANEHLLANFLCSQGRFGETLPHLIKVLPEGYSQLGTLYGNISIDNAKEHQELYLYGCRNRDIISNTSFRSHLDALRVVDPSYKAFIGNDSTTRVELFAMGDRGLGFRLTSFNDEWNDGRVYWPSYELTKVTHVDFSPVELLRDTTLPKLFTITEIKRRTLTVEVWSAVKSLRLPNELQVSLLKMTVNGQIATGVLIRKSDVVKEWGRLTLPENQEVVHSASLNRASEGVLEFSHPECVKVSLVGGKGASLAKLQTFIDEKSTTDVKTAHGFCVTTDLFCKLVDLEKITEIFSGLSVTANDQNLEDACATVMKIIKSSDAATKMSSLMAHQIEKMFGESRDKIKFAVRSSGVLEDGSDLSCAGQNDTFLGVSMDAVPKRIVDCWASLFTPLSVRYRLNHGQPAVSEMSVVIQELVDAKVAGVIFSADPRTGNPFQMIITANYGLGESVVSGSCDPDTITLTRHEDTKIQAEPQAQRMRKWWNDITIDNKILGEKKTKVVCKTELEEAQDDGLDKDSSTKETKMGDEESREFCVDEKTAIKLGAVAGEIEISMGQLKPVDIEWAIDQNGTIFILQCRNLTALDAWTDFEILHEFDTAIRTKRDRFTTANTGEVLPKALHPVGIILNRLLDFILQQQIYKRKSSTHPLSPYTCNTSPIFRQRYCLNMLQTLYALVDKEVTVAAKCVDQTIFGRQVINEEIRQAAEEVHGLTPSYNKMKDFAIQIKEFLTFKSMVQRDNETYKNFRLDYSNTPKRSLDVYNRLTEDLFECYKSCITHMIVTQCSSASQIFLFLFLSEGKKPDDWDSSLFEDASRLLAVSANVESAEMPEDMNKLGDEIVENGGETTLITKEFLEESSPEKALDWIRRDEKMSRALDEFFRKHGHRGIAELDLGEPSWATHPVSFLPILKNVVRTRLNAKNDNVGTTRKATVIYKNDDELLDSLSSNLKPMTRRLLKLILPTCRNSVICRERTKSLLVGVGDQLKKIYHYLGQLMVEDHLLPSVDLIVQLTHYEIGQLINKDPLSSIILQKVLRRQKMYPQIEKMEFPEMCIGIPREVDTSEPVIITDTIKATPVSRGIARGVAKVCMNVEEASKFLQPGDILITHGTDIAWSPFFPILGGVVTELGGLISHGAVVAREYGLPCIVSAINATKIFKTGDHVILDAGKGTLSKTDAP